MLPDVDRLVTDALRSFLPGVTVMVLLPTDWQARLPLVVASQVPGGTADYRGVARVTVDIQALAATRRDASELGRRAYSALAEACAVRYSTSEGYLGAFYDVSGLPTEVRAASPADDPHTVFRFQGTCQVVVRPARR